MPLLLDFLTLKKWVSYFGFPMLEAHVARNWEQLLGAENKLQLTTSKNLKILQNWVLSTNLDFFPLSILVLLETEVPADTLFCFPDSAIFYPLDSGVGLLMPHVRNFNGTTFKISPCTVDSLLSPPSIYLSPFSLLLSFPLFLSGTNLSAEYRTCYITHAWQMYYYCSVSGPCTIKWVHT